MALNTNAALQVSIATWATRTDLTLQIPDFITWAQQEIGRRLRSNLLLARADVAITGEFADQPDDFGAIKTFRLDLSPRVILDTTSPDIVEELCATHAPGNPHAVAVEGDQFHFAPTPTASVTGKLLYFAIPPALSAPTDTNSVLTKYPMLYLYGALEALFRFTEDDNNADRFGGQFGALIESINEQEAKDAMSGTLRPRPGAGSHP